jgi:hypothetical protein
MTTPTTLPLRADGNRQTSLSQVCLMISQAKRWDSCQKAGNYRMRHMGYFFIARRSWMLQIKSTLKVHHRLFWIRILLQAKDLEAFCTLVVEAITISHYLRLRSLKDFKAGLCKDLSNPFRLYWTRQSQEELLQWHLLILTRMTELFITALHMSIKASFLHGVSIILVENLWREVFMEDKETILSSISNMFFKQAVSCSRSFKTE